MPGIPASPEVESFFHADTSTFTHVVHAGRGSRAVIIDPVLDYDAASARVGSGAAQTVLEFLRAHDLQVEWILETHVHADHLSAGAFLHDKLGAPLAIGQGILQVQAHFKALFGLSDEFQADGRQFDRLLQDGDELAIGNLRLRVLATPGHTSDSQTFLVGDAAFIGDTMFSPEGGTARTDFPGGDAAQLHRSIRRILELPPETRLFLCHDYAREGHAPSSQSSICAQAQANIHAGGDVTEGEFVAIRQARDRALPPPRLILPALQVNIRGGRLPPPDDDGVSYLRLPLNRLPAAI
jgi:glyoxylase-like metal-dependent hydrolase (beta-lactamase superfamily II)